MEHTTGSRVIFWVWFALLGMTVLEVFLAYRSLSLQAMVILLMGLSILKAGLIIAYFMHLRYEQPSLVVTLIPALVYVLIMMTAIFADSRRLAQMKSFLQ